MKNIEEIEKPQKEKSSVGYPQQNNDLSTAYVPITGNWPLIFAVDTTWLKYLIALLGIARSESDGTRRRTGGEVKGKDANGVRSQ